jgi:ribulose-5-phosphate 4-epimerase/fuculose-1-phosphate aldolase
MVTDAAFKQPSMPLVPFAPSGTAELQENVARAVRTHPNCKVLLLEKHGIIALGLDTVMAYDVADLIEELARIAYQSECLERAD